LRWQEPDPNQVVGQKKIVLLYLALILLTTMAVIDQSKTQTQVVRPKSECLAHKSTIKMKAMAAVGLEIALCVVYPKVAIFQSGRAQH
jgi:hypothetical protein